MSKLKILPYKRKRIGRTDYRKRLALLKSEKPRLVIRKGIKNIQVQIVNYEINGDLVVIGVHSNVLKKYGWTFHKGNIPSAYLTGLLCGKIAKEKKIKEAVLDLGLYTSVRGSVQYAATKGVIDAGVNVPCGEEILPEEDSINGKNISADVHKKFLEVKEKIIGG